MGRPSAEAPRRPWRGLSGRGGQRATREDRGRPALPSPVYCCCCLANVSLPGIGGTIPESKPFFYVNVADIESLEVEVSYVACEYGALPPASRAPRFPRGSGWCLRGRLLGSHALNSGVPGTTEKIFEEKRELYDVYVDNQNVRTHHDHLQPLLKINSADREKYRRLNEQRWEPGCGARGAVAPGARGACR